MKTANAPARAEPIDLHVAHHEGLVQVHRALATALHDIGAAAPDAADALVPHALAAGRFLLGHHHAESTILFPGLRRLGRLRSADAAFLDACDRDHHRLHALCERLLANAGAPHPVVGELSLLGREIETAFLAHAAEEEEGLAPERLRAMIGREGLEEIGRELEALRQQQASSG